MGGLQTHVHTLLFKHITRMPLSSRKENLRVWRGPMVEHLNTRNKSTTRPWNSISTVLSFVLSPGANRLVAESDSFKYLIQMELCSVCLFLWLLCFISKNILWVHHVRSERGSVCTAFGANTKSWIWIASNHRHTHMQMHMHTYAHTQTYSVTLTWDWRWGRQNKWTLSACQPTSQV